MWPVIKRILERPLPDALKGLAILRFAWWWLVPYFARPRARWLSESGTAFLVSALCISLSAYFAVVALGLGDGLQYRYWVVPVTLAYVVGVYALREHIALDTAGCKTALVFAVFALVACGLQANPFAGKRYQQPSFISQEGADAVAAALNEDQAALLDLYSGVHFFSLKPEARAVMLVPLFLRVLDDDQVERLIRQYKITCVYFPTDDYVISRFTDLGFTEKQRTGDHGLFIRNEDQARMAKLGPSLEQGSLDFAAGLVNRGKTDVAIELYKAVIADVPNSTVVRIAYGSLLAQLGRFEDAVAQYQETLRLEPTNRDACFNLGVILSAMGRLEDAAGYLLRTLEVNPEDVQAAHQLGILFARKGQIDDAINYFNMALAKDPRQSDVYDSLGNALAIKGKYVEALAQYNRALELNPKDPNAHVGRGRTLVSQGKTEEAVDAYKKALVLYPHKARVHKELGDLLLKLGRTEEANEHYKAVEAERQATHGEGR
jgi:tetratricopeptide (TPR) repeat protein